MNEIDALEIMYTAQNSGLRAAIRLVCDRVGTEPAVVIQEPETVGGTNRVAMAPLFYGEHGREIFCNGTGDTDTEAALNLLGAMLGVQEISSQSAHFLKGLSTETAAVTNRTNSKVTQWFAAARANPAALRL